jgi:transcriptional regulator with XRE-family HTH domain
MNTRVREERKKRGWSQHELGSRAGIALTTISAIESGRAHVWPGWRRRLAKAFRLPEEALFAADPTGGREP